MKKLKCILSFLFIFLYILTIAGENSKQDYSKILINDYKNLLRENKIKWSQYNDIVITDLAQGILNPYREYYSASELEFVKKNCPDVGDFSPILTKYTDTGLHIVIISDGFSPKSSKYGKSINKFLDNKDGYASLFIYEPLYMKNNIMPIAVFVEDLSKKNKEADFFIEIQYDRDGKEKKYFGRNDIKDKELFDYFRKYNLKINFTNKIIFNEWNYFIMDRFNFFGDGVVKIKINNEEINLFGN